MDPTSVGEVTDVRGSLAQAGATMLIVTHEVWFARASADRVVFIKGGVVTEEGPAGRCSISPRMISPKIFWNNRRLNQINQPTTAIKQPVIKRPIVPLVKHIRSPFQND